MRIHHHLSIILFVAIVGAIGLAVGVGLLLGGLERAAHRAGKAGDQLALVQGISAAAGRMLDDVHDLTTRSSEESFTDVDRALGDSRVQLVQLRNASLVFDKATVHRAFDALEHARKLAARRSTSVRDPDELALFRSAAAGYAAALKEVEQTASVAAGTEMRLAARQRRVIMLTIGVFCLIYLAIIERVRHWTTRRLIEPIRKLADAARNVMGNSGALPQPERGETEELTTLAQMVGSFTDAMQANVLERTAQVERQKEVLEREVRVRRRAVAELRYGALHDTLTGLCSRDLLIDRVERCIVRARRVDSHDFALLFATVDQYREINDDVGHVGGDQLLVAVAERFRQCLRKLGDTTQIIESTLARAGGDEFAVLLDGIGGRPDADLVATALQQSLEKPFQVQERKLQASASIGIAFNEPEVDTAEDLLRNADAAVCYARAVGNGKHCVFSKAMHHRSTARLEKATRLREALEDGQFDLTYQPIVSLSTGRLVGFEALARWNDPKRGAISPVEFIDEAEQTGVIVQLGRWVMETACRQLQAWRAELAESASIAVSVNVSKLQLCHRGLVGAVRETLNATGLDARSLKLEITESVIVESTDSLLDVLRRLKSLGVEIHMDDFGTGYSSLSYLHRLPIDVLKIDRAFMSTLTEHHDYADVVHTVVALARTLDLKVTVEGVESEDQVARIKALDCDFAQGYYFSKPLSAESAGKLIASSPRWRRAA